MTNINKLKPVPLRNLWQHEAHDFTQWLALDENIEYINEMTGLNLINIETEKSVGNFNCDIVAKDQITNKIVIIENQLERTDHDHLGKIITYASGLNASIIIWLVKEARAEHAKAIDWLNEHLDNETHVFLVEIKAWQIGESDYAPQFMIIEEPNDFQEQIKNNISKENISPNQIEYDKFWLKFNEILDSRKSFKVREIPSGSWYAFTIGSSKCFLGVDLIKKRNQIRVNLYISDDREFFDSLKENEFQIESIFGEKLIWKREAGRKASRIQIYIENLAFDEKSIIQLSNLTIDYLERMRDAFSPFI